MVIRPGTPPPLSFETLTADHSIASFSCGNEAIDDFLQKQALAEQALGSSTVQVVCEHDRPGIVIAYYTISPTSVAIDSRLLTSLGIPEEKKPPYKALGGFLLGRLGVQTEFQGQKIGSSLIAIALENLRKTQAITGGAFLAIDPKTDRNKALYKKLGFGHIGNQDRMVIRL